MNTLDIEYINDVINSNTSVHDIPEGTKIVKINGEEYSLEDLFTKSSIQHLKDAHVKLGDIINNKDIRDKIRNRLAGNPQNTNIHPTESYKYKNGNIFQLCVGANEHRVVRFFDAKLKRWIKTDQWYTLTKSSIGELGDNQKIVVFKIGNGNDGDAYYFNLQTGAYKRIRLRDIPTSGGSASRFKYNHLNKYFGDDDRHNCHWTIFNSVIGELYSADGNLETHTKTSDYKITGIDVNTPANNYRWEYKNGIQEQIDIEDISKKKDVLEREIKNLDFQAQSNPYCDAVALWNQLVLMQNNIFNSLVLNRKDIRELSDKILQIQNNIKSKRFFGEEYIFHKKYTDLLLYCNAQLDPVFIYNESVWLKNNILKSHSLSNEEKNSYLVNIVNIQWNLGFRPSFNTSYLRPYGMSNFYNKYAFTPMSYSITPMSTFYNRAHGSLNSMLYNVNNLQYRSKQPYNYLNYINNLNRVNRPFILKYSY